MSSGRLSHNGLATGYVWRATPLMTSLPILTGLIPLVQI